MHIGLNHFLGLSGIILAAGLFCVIARRDNYAVLLGFQLIFTALNLALISFSKFSPVGFDGLIFTVLIIITGTLQITAFAGGLKKTNKQKNDPGDVS